MRSEPDADPSDPGRPSLPQVLAWPSALLLAAVAYRDLLWTQPERSLPAELERWFFVPSSTMTPVVIVLAAWLLFRRLPRLRALPESPGEAGPGLALLGAGGLVYLWATYTGATDLLVPSLMANALGAAWLWRGRAAVRVVALPVAVLVFAMPLPAPLLNQVIYGLQLGTTEVAAGLLYLLGVPHSVAGERIQLPGNTFSVIESCSGLRTMETLTLVSILMMDLFRRSGLHAWLVVLAAAPVAFLLNGVRATLLILNPHSEVAAIHNLQGVAILLAGLLILFLLDGLLEWVGSRPAPTPRGEPAAAPSASGAGSWGAPLVAGCLLVATAASFWLPRWQSEATDPLNLEERFVARLGPLSTRPLATDQLFLGSTSFRESFTLRYQTDAIAPVGVFVGVGARSARHWSPLSPKTALPGSGWIVEDSFRVTLDPAGPPVDATVLRSGSDRLLVYHWTRGASGWLAESLRSFLALDRSPFRKTSEAVIVRIGAHIAGPFPQGKERAQQTLLSFYRYLEPLLNEVQHELEKTFSRFS